MLTVKHTEEDGTESLMEFQDVHYDREKNELVGFGSPGPNVGARIDGVVRYASGHCFVMNDNGKTVGAYNLREK